MHSIYQRLNVASALLSSCLFAMLACIALTNYVHDAQPVGSLAIDSLRVKVAKVRYSAQLQHTAHLNFDFDADISPLFHWNTKQVFLYLTAEYTNKQGTTNEIAFWDKIIRTKRDANVHVRAKNKYQFKDINHSFANSSSIQYAMKYNVMPWVGTLKYGTIASTGPAEFPPPESRV